MSASSLIRSAKNKVLNYTSVQKKVRKATSNQNSIPSYMMLSELAIMSHDIYALDEMIQILNKRVNDDGKNWRHILKSLIVFQALCLYGSDRALGYCKRTIHIFQQLMAFQYFNKDQKDVGARIREISKTLTEMLSNEEVLRKAKAESTEMAEYMKVANNVKIEKLTEMSQISNQKKEINVNDVCSSRSSVGSTPNICDSDEIRLARPQNADEEAAQIKIAIEMSLKEAQFKESFSNPALYHQPVNVSSKLESLIDLDFTEPVKEKEAPYPSIYHSTSDPFLSSVNHICENKPQKLGIYSSELLGENLVPFKPVCYQPYNLKPINDQISAPPSLEKGSTPVLSPKKDDSIVENFLGQTGAKLVDMSSFESQSIAFGLHSSSVHLNPFHEPRNISKVAATSAPIGLQSNPTVYSSSTIPIFENSGDAPSLSFMGISSPHNPFNKNEPAVTSLDPNFDELFGVPQNSKYSFDNKQAQPEKDIFSDF